MQRKSILDAERTIAELVEQRDGLQSERELQTNEALIRARVTQLWQTRMLRTAKLTVADEIENALSYYRVTFLRQIPRLYGELEAALPGHPIAPFFRMGNWIGGDRDGNPFVTAETLQIALARQAETVLRFYLTEVHELGAELSISASLAPISTAMRELAARSPDHGAHRDDEPYRRVLIGIYARLAATLEAYTGTAALRHAVAPAGPVPVGGRVPGRPLGDRGIAALQPRPRADRAPAHAADARGAGVRLPPRDGRPAAELRQARGRGRRAATAREGRGRLQRPARAGAARAAAAPARRRPARLRVKAASYSEHAVAELAIFEAAVQMLARYGREALRHYIISHTEDVSDLLE